MKQQHSIPPGYENKREKALSTGKGDAYYRYVQLYLNIQLQLNTYVHQCE
jgi:hypothetical protein